MIESTVAVAVAVGRHLLADLYGVRAPLLRNADALDAMLQRAATAAGARILGSHFHRFDPTDGVTGVVLLAESHISIHTWPESGFAAVDIFMCGRADPELALAVVLVEAAPLQHQVQTATRGGR